MCSCGKVNSIPKIYTPAPSPQIVPNCVKSRTEIQTLYNRMVCVKETTSSKKVNYYLGILLTMLNLNEYCKYDVVDIEVYANNNNC